MSLFLRVKQNTDDLSLGKKALKMEAYCLLSLKRLHEALSLLEPEETFMYSTEPLLACAYQMVGNPLQAKQVLQEGIYKKCRLSSQSVAILFGTMISQPGTIRPNLLPYSKPFQCLFFKSTASGPSASLLFSHGAGLAGFAKQGKGLAGFGRIHGLATGDIFPLRLHGDSFFDQLDDLFLSARRG